MSGVPDSAMEDPPTTVSTPIIDKTSIAEDTSVTQEATATKEAIVLRRSTRIVPKMLSKVTKGPQKNLQRDE
jgi:hypothetical protein